jgi:spermidine/putrescine transport system ATP-binding protein
MAPVAIALTGVSKQFGGVAAVNDVSLEIGEGEFFSLLGPSGCGKTTTLRMIAGFETPDVGRVVLQGSDVTATPANRRPVNMVFQQYALFPHMTIYDNVAFGLRMRGVPRGEHRVRVTEILRIVSLEGYERRRPRQLSGGQQQRVALARALVNRPAALLLDEPLGALDVKLRKQMQLELKRIQHELGTTFVYVTHDQDEALAMSDRIAVMNRGRVEQLGTPRQVYEQPSTEFVADFIGSLNALDIDGTRVTIRPEHVQVGATPENAPRLTGTLAEVVYLGMYTQLHVDTRVGRIVSHRLAGEPAARLQPGAAVTVWWSPDEATASLGDAPAGLRADDDRQGDDEHDHGDGDHLR